MVTCPDIARVGHDHLGPVNGQNGCRADTDALNGTLGAAYRVIDNGMTSIDLLAGECCFKLVVDFDAVVGGGKIKYSDSGDVLDGNIGAQVLTSLSERWYVSFYADVGGGDSKLTWQAWPGVGYRLDNIDAVAGYRHLEWETDDGDTFKDPSFSGPMLGVKFSF